MWEMPTMEIFLNRLAASSEAEAMVDVVAKMEKPVDSPEVAPDDTVPSSGPARMTLSAPAPAYDTACQDLGLDPANPRLEVPSNWNQPATTLKQWQVTGASWMLRQERSPVGGGILADAYGLGKTTTAITLLWYASILAERDGSHVHKPTLILCPPALVDTWLAELTTRLGDAFTILLFQGSSQHTSDYLRMSLTVDTIGELRSRLDALDDTKVETSRTIVLSSYTTWSLRTMTETDRKGKGCMDQVDGADGEENERAIEILAKIQEAEAVDDTATDGDISDSGPGRKAREIKTFDTLAAGWFGRVVANEGHAAKTIRTKVYQSVAQLGADHYWFLTATPMYNRAFDICGYLAILFPAICRRPETWVR